jgi:hypothetical protein
MIIPPTFNVPQIVPPYQTSYQTLTERNFHTAQILASVSNLATTTLQVSLTSRILTLIRPPTALVVASGLSHVPSVLVNACLVTWLGLLVTTLSQLCRCKKTANSCGTAENASAHDYPDNTTHRSVRKGAARAKRCIDYLCREENSVRAQTLNAETQTTVVTEGIKRDGSPVPKNMCTDEPPPAPANNNSGSETTREAVSLGCKHIPVEEGNTGVMTQYLFRHVDRVTRSFCMLMSSTTHSLFGYSLLNLCLHHILYGSENPVLPKAEEDSAPNCAYNRGSDNKYGPPHVLPGLAQGTTSHPHGAATDVGACGGTSVNNLRMSVCQGVVKDQIDCVSRPCHDEKTCQRDSTFPAEEPPTVAKEVEKKKISRVQTENSADESLLATVHSIGSDTAESAAERRGSDISVEEIAAGLATQHDSRHVTNVTWIGSPFVSSLPNWLLACFSVDFQNIAKEEDIALIDAESCQKGRTPSDDSGDESEPPRSGLSKTGAKEALVSPFIAAFPPVACISTYALTPVRAEPVKEQARARTLPSAPVPTRHAACLTSFVQLLQPFTHMQRLQLSVYELLVHAVLCRNSASSNLACWPIVTNTRAVAVRFTGQVLSTAIILPVYVCCQANCFRRHAINCLIRRQRMICNLVSLSTIACMLAVTWRLLGLSIPRLAMFTLLFVTLIAFSILALLCIALRRQPQLVAMITSGRTCPEVPQVNHRGGTVADTQTDNRAANISDQIEVDGNPQGQPPTNGPVSAPADPDTDLNAVNEACLRDLRSVLDIIDVSHLDPDLLALYLDPSAGIVERMGILRSHPVHKDDAHRLMVCFRHNMKLGREAVFKRRALSSNPVSDSSELLQPSSDPCLVKALPAAVEILPQVSNKIPDALQPTIRVHKLAPTPQPSQLGSPLRNPLSEPLTTVASLPSPEPVTPVQPCSDNHVPRITSDAPHRIRIHRISELPRDDRYGHGTVHIARTPTLLVRAPVDSPSAQDKTTRLEPSAILRDTVYNAPQAPLDSYGAPHRIRIHRLTDDDIVVDSALASNLHSVHSAPSFQQPALGSPARCIEHPIAAVGGGSTRQLQSQPRSQIGKADHILPLSTDPSEGVHILACPIPASKFFDHSAQEPVSPLVAQQPQSDVAPFPDSSSPT